MSLPRCHIWSITLIFFLWDCYLPSSNSITEGISRKDDSDAPSNTTTKSGVERYDECVLVKSNASYAQRVMESYLELGYYDIMREVDISFDVLPSRFSHDGPLFSIGTEDFQYYEWKTKAFKTQYFVIEFVYSAMSMLLKALKEPHMSPMEICRTYPRPYDLGDGQWHYVRARRESRRNSNEADMWFLQLDDVEINRTVSSKTNVFLQDRPAYLGGRPGYRSSQFRGVIKNFRIRGERIPLRGRATYGLVEVWHCSAPEVQKFVDSIQNPPQLARGRIQSSIGRRRGGGHIRPKKPGEEEEGLEEEESLGEGEMEEENEEADDTGMGEKGDTMGESEPDTPVL